MPVPCPRGSPRALSCYGLNAGDEVLSYKIADSHLMPSGINSSYDDSIPTASTRFSATQEYDMSRLIPISFGALQIGLAAAAMYILCSADVLHQTAVYFH